MEERNGDMKKYYEYFDRRFHTIVTMMLLKINSAACQLVVRFRILERIYIRSYIFVTIGTVGRPFRVKTYH